MAERDLVEQIAELTARVKRLERWQEQWRVRTRRIEELISDKGIRVTATQGLGANFSFGFTPPFQSYNPGMTVLASKVPATGYHSILPARWQLPPKVGNIEPVVRLVFSDNTTFDFRNTGTSQVFDTREANFFVKDGLTVIRVELIADNVSGAAESRGLGTLAFEGEQV
jgi:hypothetical protein